MSFLLDTNICSAYLRGDGRVYTRIIQHSGGLRISAVVLGELYAWIFRARTDPRFREGLDDLLAVVDVLPVDTAVARRFGELRAEQLDIGRPRPQHDLFIAATALTHDLTLVTHNIRDFADVPILRVQNWLSP